jgi:hypothetical protein
MASAEAENEQYAEVGALFKEKEDIRTERQRLLAEAGRLKHRQNWLSRQIADKLRGRFVLDLKTRKS